MDVDQIGKSLGSKNRIKIIQTIGHKKMTAVKCYEILRKDSRIRRESIYRELECLRAVGILQKQYDSNTKKLFYSLRFKTLTLDLITMQVIENKTIK